MNVRTSFSGAADASYEVHTVGSDATLLSYFPILPDVLYLFASAKDQPQHCRDKESKSSKWQGCDWIRRRLGYRFGRDPLDSDTI
jgi:hypothetical protein